MRPSASGVSRPVFGLSSVLTGIGVNPPCALGESAYGPSYTGGGCGSTVTPEELQEKYRNMLSQREILVLEENGCLSDYSLVLRRAERLIATGRVDEAKLLLEEIAQAVRESRNRERETRR